jgi:hypothetical protein
VVGPRLKDPSSWAVRVWVEGELAFEHEAVDSLIDGLSGEAGSRGEAESFDLSWNRERDKAFCLLDELPRQDNRYGSVSGRKRSL